MHRDRGPIARVPAAGRVRAGLGLLLIAGLTGTGAVAAGVALLAPVDRADRRAPRATFVENEFIVVLKAEARRTAEASVDARTHRPRINLRSLQELTDRFQVTRLARQFPAARPQPTGSRFHDLTGHYKVRLPAGADLDAALAAFSSSPEVARVERIGIHPIHSCATGTPRTPNDTYFQDAGSAWAQWNLWDAHGIGADMAWEIETGAAGVVLVSMDSGVRYEHGDLGGLDPPGPADGVTDGNVWVNPHEIPGNGIDDEGNGRVDDVIGWDFVSGNPAQCAATSGEDCDGEDNDPRDFSGHGTHTAGTMAALTANGMGVAGVAGGFGDGTRGSAGNGVKLLLTRIGWADEAGRGFVRMDYAAEALSYVADLKARGVNIAAVNASWGSSDTGGFGPAVDNVLAADVLIVHAAGNSGADTPDFLGGKAGVLDVAATDRSGQLAAFSSFGSWVEIAAPGVEILSTWHQSSDPATDYYALLDGTSMAAPQVAGVVGLLESCNPSLSRSEKLALIVEHACPSNDARIAGILDARLALEAAGCGGCGGDAECDDGAVCNGAEVCVAGRCAAGTPPICDDDDACTADRCQDTAGCRHDALACDDGDACTTDSCDPSAGCRHVALSCPAGASCIDGACRSQTCDDDAVCDAGEDCVECPGDCVSGGTAGGCGDGVCGVGEDCVVCPLDCRGKQNGKFTQRFCCSGGVASRGDNPVDCGDPRCSADGFACGEVQPYCCGDDRCDAGEDSCNCAIDCGAPLGESGYCADGADNDCDRLIDCADTANCGSDPACACLPTGARCSSGGACCSGRCRRGVCRGD